MITHDSQKDFLEWLRERRLETNDRRRGQQEYSAKNHAWYLGIQWFNGGSGAPFAKYAEKLAGHTGSLSGRGGPAAMKVTLNKLTQNIISVGAATSPRRISVYSMPNGGIGRPTDAVEGDVAEAIANSVIEDSGTLSLFKRTNFERTIDGFHGFGHRIEVTGSGENIDMRQRAFDFCGYQLTLDPTVHDQQLSNHEYVIFTEVLTLHAAKRLFGEKNLSAIDESKLSTVGQLMSIESKWNAITGGAMFQDVSRLARAKGMVVHTTFLRGPSKRFDRMLVTIDGTSSRGAGIIGDRSVINWDVNLDGNGNPYGGIGMPLHALYGYPRPGDLHGISDVAMSIDSQEKLNIAASIYFQSLWNYVQKTIFVDRKSLEDSKLTENQFRRQMDSGVVFMNIRNRDGKYPQQMIMPQPPQAVGNDMERFGKEVLQSTFRTSSHVGENKSHVSDKTAERSIEKSEIASEDRVDSDVGEYERYIESLTSTQIKIAQSGAPTPTRMLVEAGLSDEQIGVMLRIDPHRHMPRFKISEDAIRRRSRSEKKQDLNTLVSSGAITDPTEMRRIFAEMDMPVSEQDKIMIQYSNVTAAKVAMGAPFEPKPMGSHSQYMIEALQRACVQTTNPMASQALQDAIRAQNQADSTGQKPQEMTMDGAVNAAFNPNAVRA